MSMAEEESVYFGDANKVAKLSQKDAALYLSRIGLDPDHHLVGRSPSLEGLSEILTAHHLTVPYSTASLHVIDTDWNTDGPISFGQGDGMPLGYGSFRRVVLLHQGGFCFALNTSLASLLRTLGYRCSECGGRPNLLSGKDHALVGYEWGNLNHLVLIVDWIGSEARYLVDAGFGGGSSVFPIVCKDGATQRSLLPHESFILRQESLPGNMPFMHDPAPGYTLYRRILPPQEPIADPAMADSGPGYWSALYHFTLASLAPVDITVTNHYNESHADGLWQQTFLVTRALADGSRRTLIAAGGRPAFAFRDVNEGQTTTEIRAKLYTKNGTLGQETDVKWIAFDKKAIFDVLVREFGFRASQRA